VSAPTVTVRLTNSAERLVRMEHPWLYAESIRSASREGEAGDLAVIFDHKRALLALGLWDPDSPIRVRVLHRGKPRAIDRTFFAERIRTALELRAPLAAQDTTGYRVVNGESDFLPGLVLDRYDATLVLKLYTSAWLPHLPEVLAAIEAELGPERVVLRLARSIVDTSEERAGLADGAILSGATLDGPVVFRENGLRFRCDPVRGQKTGFFLDQRENRKAFGARARGKRVLNAFSYSGGFSVYAARGGAAHVVSLDSSAPALEDARANFALNAEIAEVAHAEHELVCDDAFAALARFAAEGRRFELVVIDPPAFAKARREVAGALSAYTKLAELGCGVLAPGGEIAIASCSARVDAGALAAAIQAGAARAKLRLVEEQRTAHALDHPVRFAEGAYLKCIWLRAATPSR
jgi:23S rRNA (cytosine1962-C5)-methyltransferase